MSKNKLIITGIFLVYSIIIYSQKQISFGTNIGGPIPVKMTEGSSAKVFPGLYISFSKQVEITDNFVLNPSLSIDYKMLNYFTSQRKDTIVEAEVLGVMANIPTYYKADISGKLKSSGLYIELPLAYKLSDKISLGAGIYASGLVYKSDIIDINVKIGEGGLLPDIDSTYNNKDNINNFDLGLQLGGNFVINEKISLSMVAYRSLSRFYKYNTLKDDAGNDLPFYYTQVRFGINYAF